MAIPEQVRRQAERADELMKKWTEADAQHETPTAEENQTPPSATPTEQTPATPAEATATPEAGTPSTPSTPVETPSQETDAEYWKRRFEVMEGKYQSEVPQLHQQLQQSRQQMQDLQEQMEQLKGDREQESQTPTEAPNLDTSNLEESLQVLENTYGPEFVKPFRDQENLLSTMQQRNQTLADELAQLKTQVQDVAQSRERDQEQEFFEALAREVPDWQRLNEDPGFIQWLQQVEPLSGQPMIQLLNQARQDLDANRAAQFFTSYKASTGQAPPSHQESNQPNPEAEKERRSQERQQELERKIAPGETRAGEAPNQPPHYTRDRIAQVYRDYALGRMTDQEFAQHESAIREAQNNGTVS